MGEHHQSPSYSTSPRVHTVASYLIRNWKYAISNAHGSLVCLGERQNWAQLHLLHVYTVTHDAPARLHAVDGSTENSGDYVVIHETDAQN